MMMLHAVSVAQGSQRERSLVIDCGGKITVSGRNSNGDLAVSEPPWRSEKAD
jgi:hypothetical protein